MNHRSTILLATVGAAAAFVAFTGAGCTGTIGSDGVPEDVGDVADSLCVVDTPMRRLTRTEFNNTIRDLLGDTTHPADVLPAEEEVKGFDNQAAALTVSNLLVEQYMKVAEDISVRATEDVDAILPGCSAVEGESCAVAFIADFAARAYRRPPTQEELDRLKGLYDWALADADLGAFEDGIQVVIQEVLQSPSFLYRPEFGGGDPVAGDVLQMTSWEMASKLSYMLWNSMPDEELFLAAENDALRDKELIAAHARRMLDDPRAKDAIRNFHRQWLLLTHLDTVTKDESVYPNYDDALRPLWEEEVARFVEHVILEDDAKLTTLLTASYSFMNDELAAFYGDDVAGAAPGAAFERVDLDPERRAGLLTSAALMASLAKLNQTSPVFRGKFVREQLMCDSLPLPPNDLVIVPPDLDPDKTTKEQFEEIGANPTCAPCHNLMNPIGFVFEHYDAIGQWRDTQNDQPIDAVGDVIETRDIDGTYDGAVELAKALAESQQVSDCVVSQWFRFNYNRTVTANDGCTLDSLHENFTATGGDIKELLVAMTQTNAFLYRRQVVAGGEP
jgi:hypothetical protein